MKPVHTRREALIGIASFAAFGARPALATPEEAAKALHALTGGAAAKPGGIALTLPEMAADAANVPLTVEVESPMTAENFVQAIHVLAENNPFPQLVSFRLTPGAGKAEVQTRIRLRESQNVVAAAVLSDGSVHAVKRKIVVTAGGCGIEGVGEASAPANPAPKIRVARQGTLYEVKTLVSHEMETGLRHDKSGNPIPRRILKSFVCKVGGQSIFEATLHPGVAANPFLAFHARPEAGQAFEFVWTEDSGRTIVERREVKG
ncbi:MAG: thiosulfate oxidation carrier complex protein SoxZ [Rhodospirillales bacterium]|nr:thiosulfate oxidation carrier complex protein SoxZ [Rhodospirillales bacterium]